jgi:hypothetical protein
MVTVHVIVGVSVLAANLAAGVWGGLAWWRNRPAVGFWYVLRTAQALVVLQVMVGAILVISGHQATEDLHYVYGLLPLVVTLLAEGARAGASERELTGLDFDSLPTDRRRAIVSAIARREAGIMSVSALVVFLLALRAAGTSAGLF